MLTQWTLKVSEGQTLILRPITLAHFFYCHKETSSLYITAHFFYDVAFPSREKLRRHRACVMGHPWHVFPAGEKLLPVAKTLLVGRLMLAVWNHFLKCHGCLQARKTLGEKQAIVRINGKLAKCSSVLSSLVFSFFPFFTTEVTWIKK